MASLECFSCHKRVQIADRVGFRETCLHCGADLHACKQCQFYDPTAYNECREPSADRILEKEKANYCEFFSSASLGGGAAKPKVDHRALAEALFKKKN